MVEKKGERSITYDLMKVMGVLSAMLVHFPINESLLQILSYSVPMLIFLSGLLAKGAPKDYLRYLINRIKRIVIPTYIFIIAIFVCRAIVVLLYYNAAFYSKNEIVETVFLGDNGIGYIWITRVFFMIAVFAPIITGVNTKIKSDVMYTAIQVSVLMLYFFLLRMFEKYELLLWFQYTIYIIPYYFVYSLGSRCRKSKRFLYGLLFVSTVVLCVMILSQGFYPRDSKYPPGMLYIVYGIVVSVISFLGFNAMDNSGENYLSNLKSKLKWLSINSFNIYLMHAFLNICYGWVKNKMPFAIPVILEISINFILSIVCIVYIEGIRKMRTRLSE